jgi:hypothetical protein
MPEIPLFQGGQQAMLPALPGPVLDRERRLRVDAGGIITGLERVKRAGGAAADASMEPLMPLDMFAGEARGVQALAEGLQSASGVMTAFLERRQEAINNRNIGLAKNRMETAYAEHIAQRNPARPETWNDDLQQRFNGLKSQLSEDQTLSAFARNEVNAYLDNYLNQASNRVLIESGKALFGQEQDLHAAEIAKAKQDRNLPRAVELLAEGVPKGYWSDGSAQVQAIEIRKDMHALDRQDAMAANPRKFLEDLRKPVTDRPEFMRGMSEAEDISAEYNAIAALERGREAVTALYQADISSGKLSDPNDVWRKRSVYDPRGLLSDDDIETIMNLAASPDPNDPGYFERMHLNISRYSAKNDPSGAERAMIATTIGQRFKGPMEQELQAQLREQSERTKAAGLDALDGEYTRALNELNQMFEDGEFGSFKVPAANISYDHKIGKWVRSRDPWEPSGPPIPIRISEENERKLTAGAFKDKDGKTKPDVLIDDINARDEAARKLQMRRTLLQKRRAEGKYETPTGMMDEFKASIEQPTKESARLKLPTWETVPGNPLLPDPSQSPLPSEEQRKSLLNKYAPAR